MPGMRVLAATVLALAGLVTLSCGGITDPSKNTVETFSGTLLVGGQPAVHPFSASKTGEISVKVTALSPVSNTFIGLLWAQAQNDGNCAANVQTLQQTLAQLNIPAIAGPIVSGRYCLFVYDAVGFTAPENYTVTVSHP
jgi:hypothetical protein